MTRKQAVLLILQTLDRFVLMVIVNEAQKPFSRKALAAVFTMDDEIS